MRLDSRYLRAFLISSSLFSVPCLERRAYSAPNAKASGLHVPSPSGLSPKRLLPDKGECERCLVVELVPAKNELKKGQPISIDYKIINKSKTLIAEFDVYYGPHVAIAFSVFSAVTGERLSKVQTGMPKILGVKKPRLLGPGDTYEGTFRLDKEYDLSRAGSYRIVGNNHFRISDETSPDWARPFMKYSNSLFIRIVD